MSLDHQATPVVNGEESAPSPTADGLNEGSPIKEKQPESSGGNSNGARSCYSTARKGKIARLPHEIREEVNERLENGEEGGSLLDWLNSNPKVHEILQAQFGGVPISKQNLSEWRQGGYREWKVREELLDHASDLADFAGELDDSVDADLIGDHLTKVVTLRYAALLRGWNGQADAKFEAELRVLQRLSQDVLQLQKGVHRGSRFKDEWERRLEKKFEDEKALRKAQLLAPIWAMMKRGTWKELFGGGAFGEKMADYINAIHYDLPLPKDDPADKAGQAKSNQVKPDLPPV